MREGVGSDDRLGPLGLHAGEAGDQAAGGDDLGSVDRHVEIEIGATGANRHHDVLSGGIAGALAQPVETGIYPLGAMLQRGERVGDRQAQIVVAVGGDAHAGKFAREPLPPAGQTPRAARSPPYRRGRRSERLPATTAPTTSR